MPLWHFNLSIPDNREVWRRASWESEIASEGTAREKLLSYFIWRIYWNFAIYLYYIIYISIMLDTVLYNNMLNIY